MAARWFRLEGTAQRGPVDLDHIRRLVLDGVVGPDTYVWSDGMPDWKPAREVPALVPPPELRPRDPRWPPDPDRSRSSVPSSEQ